MKKLLIFRDYDEYWHFQLDKYSESILEDIKYVVDMTTRYDLQMELTIESVDFISLDEEIYDPSNLKWFCDEDIWRGEGSISEVIEAMRRIEEYYGFKFKWGTK